MQNRYWSDQLRADYNNCLLLKANSAADILLSAAHDFYDWEIIYGDCFLIERAKIVRLWQHYVENPKKISNIILTYKINTIPLALNIINYISSKSHTPDLPRDRTNPPIFSVFTNRKSWYHAVHQHLNCNALLRFWFQQQKTEKTPLCINFIDTITRIWFAPTGCAIDIYIFRYQCLCAVFTFHQRDRYF